MACYLHQFSLLRELNLLEISLALLKIILNYDVYNLQEMHTRTVISKAILGL